MKRRQLFEFTDLKFVPSFLREGITDFLATIISKTDLYRPTLPILKEAIEASGEKNILVLGAGSGGGILDLLHDLGPDIRVTLTDLYPHANFKSSHPNISYRSEPVDATRVPPQLSGVRVMFTVYHHLNEHLSTAVLADAVRAAQPILIFEGSERSFKGMIINLFVPLFVLVLTPIIKPRKVWRFIFTYPIPLLPLMIAWDGLISSLRTYTVEEMRAKVKDLDAYSWEIGKLSGPRGEPVTYLKGLPKTLLSS